MQTVSITLAQARTIRQGKTLRVTLPDSTQIDVTPHMAEYAKAFLMNGGRFTILPLIIGTNVMDLVAVTI